MALRRAHQALRMLSAGSGPSLDPPVWQTTRPGWLFSVSSANGFMPASTPIEQLPPRYAPLDALLKAMPIERRDGKPGLLATGELEQAVRTQLPLIDTSQEHDPALVAALFRDYTFLASAYMLEPSHKVMVQTGKYGQARGRLPENVAVPLVQLADKLDTAAILDYAHSYALNNWAKLDPSRGFELDNLRLIRSFSGNVDESGFVLIHIAMVAQTGRLVAAQQHGLSACARQDIPGLAAALHEQAHVLRDIFDIFTDMWAASSPSKYLSFRTFIFGSKDNKDMFPDGIVFEGVKDGHRDYRGESGSQDTIVPAVDTFTQMLYPKNKLTEYLVDLRSYRPKDHQAYLGWIKDAAAAVRLKATAFEHPDTAYGLLNILDVVQQIRSQHWSYTKAYIIKNSKHPRATAGTPVSL